MGFSDLVWHLLNFIAPAVAVAFLISGASRVLMKQSPKAGSPWFQAAINSIVGVLVLTAGLWTFGNDGKMLTYAALVLVCASVQWILARHWKA